MPLAKIFSGKRPSRPTTEFVIPNELLELILQMLYNEGHFSSIKACSLTCHHLCSSSQRLLFQRINVKADSLSHFKSSISHYFLPLPAGLIVMLRESSHLVKYVKKFKLELRSQVPKMSVLGVEGGSGSIFGGFTSALHELAPMAVFEPPTEEDIPLVRDFFAGLTTIRLAADHGACPWYLSTSGLIRTLGQALSVTTTLKTLDVTGVPDFPIALLKGCTTLRKLKVLRLVEEDHAEVQVTELVNYLSEAGTSVVSADQDTRCMPTFLHLSAQSSIHTLQLLRCPRGAVNFGEIRELSIQWGQYSDLQECGIRVSDWPRLVGLRLRALDWQLFTQYNTSSSIRKVHRQPVPALTTFNALQTITICAAFQIWLVPNYSLIDYFTSPLCWIVDVLESASQSRHTLTEVVLKLDFKNFTELEGMILSKFDWSPLETLYRSFAKLVKVVVYFRISTPEQERRLLSNEGLQRLKLQNFEFQFCIR
ncbi:hypothetical protein CPB83DRAFT_858762 [Crepidotus variabilis]|uniref:F-box domain-containing protein n=1 Tax=Crepidotus variabilis TaxID=179855 RepID=A0A9P6EBE2_9AGAR|nr:hypothetical protein CPB83DRAFT_858762 [Crepidotus variabilis]